MASNASAQLLALQARAEAMAADYQRLQAQVSDVVEARQRLEAQQSENELVKKEFTTLTEENTVYKLIGPILVKQDQAEAKSNVDTRLEFIKGEIKRVEGQLKDLEEKSEKKKSELVEVQIAMQQQSNPGAAPAPVAA